MPYRAPPPTIEKPLLLADIGGTNARFSLIGEGVSERTLVLPSARFSSLDAATQEFLSTIPAEHRPRHAAFAVAGPVMGDEVTLTNLSWRFSIAKLKDTLGLARLEVINDFTAVALAIPQLSTIDIQRIGSTAGLNTSITGGTMITRMPVAVLGPGSGLGVSGLILAPGGGWLPLSGEGGHVLLAPADDRESDILRCLRREFGPVSAERVVSGPGLINLYHALCSLDGRTPTQTAAADITTAALNGSCPFCRETLEVFASFLGNVAGNLALTLGARGGVYIAGGIVPRLGIFLERSAFRRRFVEKGPQQSYLEAIPSFVITHPHPAFLGLASLFSQ